MKDIINKTFNFIRTIGIMNKVCSIGILISSLLAVCSGVNNRPSQQEPSNDRTGNIPGMVDPDVTIQMRGTKINQLVGDWDRERDEPTQNQTFTRYQLWGTDLGVSFQARGRTWILFGDSWRTPEPSGGLDAIAYTTDNDPEDGLLLDFVTNNEGTWQPITIPGISQRSFEVPLDGVGINGNVYIYHSTDSDRPHVTMGRSVLARANDMEHATFDFLYTFSVQHFINISIVKVDNSEWCPPGSGLPEDEGKGLVFFGSGRYRKSNIFLAYQPATKVEDSTAIKYFAGINDAGAPLWSLSENVALPIFDLGQPCVGELSVSYNTFIDRWILLYNCDDPRRINMQTAEFPWGPWTEPQVIFDPQDDNGFCHFIHMSWEEQNCDSVHDPGRENVRGSGYGPFQLEHFATGNDQSTTIYFTLSPWNPYTVILMKAKLRKKEK